ncbi:Surfeit locus protein 1 [Hondaea fermentalgiana]|uniref:SURF1-like protein n=1 Tax=Hondaea fermentalgiana TaxID=2315210 RepID=A0A2R5GAK7_9STRA|nr:Surfeit locus protein 1 [Hondaea fermentalgiana]|eukprot:GBG25121.1 Surfeit locus protein 1 [Hondaea fermentalgiana]
MATRRGVDWLGLGLFGSLAAGTFGLGSWQVKRYFWKVDLVEERRRMLERDAVPLAEASRPYERVRCSGTFDYAQSMFVGPRSAPAHGVQGTGAMQPSGWYVVTPFTDKDSGKRVLVNRGWIPRDQQQLALQGLEKGLDAESFDGVLAKAEEGGTFTPDKLSNESVEYFRMDVETMRAQRGLPENTPLVERVQTSPQEATIMPRPKAPEDMMVFQVHPMTHVGYAATWYGLSAAGLFLIRKRFL